MSECFPGSAFLQSGTDNKERAVPEPDARRARKSPLLSETGAVGQH